MAGSTSSRPPGRRPLGGFVCGLVGLALSWVIPLVGVLLGLLGIVLGGVSIARSRTAGAGKGLSVAGVVLGVLAVGVAIIFWNVYANLLRQS